MFEDAPRLPGEAERGVNAEGCTGQLPRAFHAYMGHRLQEIDMMLWHFYIEIRRAHGEESDTAVKANSSRWLLWDLRMLLIDRCEQEYGLADTTVSAYRVPPVGLGTSDRRPWALPPDEGR